MNRKEITKLLTNTLISTKLNDRKYYAKEVTLDYGTSHPKRVDVMQFEPQGVIHASDIEKGTFTCYEIKSCKEDVYSGNGLRFYGERNYIVTTMECWKNISDDFRNGKLNKYIKEKYPDSSTYFGIMALVPANLDIRNSDELFAEFENPTPLSEDTEWKFAIVSQCRPGPRTRSITELMFCMLRAKHSAANTQ